MIRLKNGMPRLSKLPGILGRRPPASRGDHNKLNYYTPMGGHR